MKKIGIIGGGAAGMMAAVTLLENIASDKDVEIHIFEKNNRLGAKVAITGGGRCNLTTGIEDLNLIMSKYIRGEDFVKPAILAFPPDKVRQWFEEHGVPTKVEKDNRVFPLSDIGQDVVDCFKLILNDPRVKIHYTESVEDVYVDENPNLESKFLLKSIKQDYVFDFLIITTGGNAYSKTGSTGDGYEFAKKLGHSITTLGPSLSSFNTRETWSKSLSGLSFQNAQFKVSLKTGVIVSIQGAMIFTHFGISGPLTFALSAYIAHEKITLNDPVVVKFVPDAEKDFKFWDKNLLETFSISGTKQVINSLALFIPQRYCEKVLEAAKIPFQKISAEITRDERLTIARLLSGEMIITLISRKAEDEFVTSGGISSLEINRKTMQSKIRQNLFFAGEILNVDGLTGGFNLQSAWSTGRLAGLSIAKNI